MQWSIGASEQVFFTCAGFCKVELKHQVVRSRPAPRRRQATRPRRPPAPRHKGVPRPRVTTALPHQNYPFFQLEWFVGIQANATTCDGLFTLTSLSGLPVQDPKCTFGPSPVEVWVNHHDGRVTGGNVRKAPFGVHNILSTRYPRCAGIAFNEIIVQYSQ